MSEQVYRKRPSQRRSVHTVESILQAASEILASEGEAAITTTRVAERAGVSIGTLYQYFGDRDALLLGIAEHQRQQLLKHMQRLLVRFDPSKPEPAAEFIRILIASFAKRRGASRQFALLSDLRVMHGKSVLDDIAETIAGLWDQYVESPHSAQSNRIHAYVLTRALLGVLRSAAIEEIDFFHDKVFEQSLCRIVEALSPSLTLEPAR